VMGRGTTTRRPHQCEERDAGAGEDAESLPP
jgi:hypothetical protein